MIQIKNRMFSSSGG